MEICLGILAMQHTRDLCPTHWPVKSCTSNQSASVWTLRQMCTLSPKESAALWTCSWKFITNPSFDFRPFWGCKLDASASLPCFHVPGERCLFTGGGDTINWMMQFFSCYLHSCDILLNLIGMPLALHYLKEIPAVFPAQPNNWKTCHATSWFNDIHHHSVPL